MCQGMGRDMSCAVCCEDFNKVTRREVACQYCAFSACRKCVTTYILGTTEDVHCLSCKKAWSREFMVDNLSKAFVFDELKRHRENILIEREKALLPATQPIVEAMKSEKDVLKELNEFERRVQQERNGIYQRLTELRNVINGTSQSTERRQFIRACPAEGCRGFLSTQWKCGLCDTRVCNECLEIKGHGEAEHVCKPENVETAKQIARDTKPCPKCASMIHKIDGCSQIWCTQCHTAFDWNTMRIETGRIHNPHYYQWLREQSATGEIPREPGDGPCGAAGANNEQLPNPWNYVHQLRLALGVADVYSVPEAAMLINTLRQFHHIQHVFHQYRTNYFGNNRDLRIAFLMNELTEDAWKKQLQYREKKTMRNMAYEQVADLLRQVGHDLFNRVETTPLPDLLKEFDELREFANQAFQSISKQFKSTPKYLNVAWDLV
jgi:hypothetical protein